MKIHIKYTNEEKIAYFRKLIAAAQEMIAKWEIKISKLQEKTGTKETP